MPNKVEQSEDGKTMKVQLETGEVFEGDPISVTNKMAEAHVSTKRWGQEWKTKAETPPAATPVPPAANQEEANLQKYLLDQQAKALGLSDGAALKARLEQMGQITERVANQAVAADFMNACPDFPNTQPAIDAISKKVEEMGYDYTPQSMIAAHMLCMREDKYKPLTAEEQNSTWANNMQAASRRQEPPMLRSGSPDANAQNFDPHKVPLNELRERVIREQLNGAS